jgi:hypothetical protein
VATRRSCGRSPWPTRTTHQSIAGTQELVGPEVVMAHRLLKTGAAALVGHGAYALITEVAAAQFEVPTDDAFPLVESYEHYAPIRAHVYSLRDAPARSQG